MDFSSMRDRITIQQLGPKVANGGGGYTRDWQDYATVWASVKPQVMTEGWYANQQRPTTVYKIMLRYRTDLSLDMRIIWQSRTGQKILDIQSIIDPNDLHQQLTLQATEGKQP